MPEYSADFQEIAHCGGQLTFHVRVDGDSQRGVAFGFRHARPNLAAIVGIYALLPQGIPVGDFRIGGIGDAFDPPAPADCCPVFLGSDSQGKFGHQCPRCHSDFRNFSHSSYYPLCCPYCGFHGAAFQFLTSAQKRYVRHFIDTFLSAFNVEMQPNTDAEIVIDMDAVIDQESGIARPDFYYAAKAQQTWFTCDKCGEFNDIRGLYGYCAACGWRNNARSFVDAADKLRQGLNENRMTPVESVKASISKFDGCCRNFVAQIIKLIPMRQARKIEFDHLKFHDFDNDAFKRLTTMFDVDPLRGIANPERNFLKMMLNRRHIYEHNDGVVDERYVRASGDDGARVGDLMRESQGNAHRLLSLLRRAVENFQSDFHEIFKLTDWPIDNRRAMEP